MNRKGSMGAGAPQSHFYLERKEILVEQGL